MFKEAQVTRFYSKGLFNCWFPTSREISTFSNNKKFWFLRKKFNFYVSYLFGKFYHSSEAFYNRLWDDQNSYNTHKVTAQTNGYIRYYPKIFLNDQHSESWWSIKIRCLVFVYFYYFFFNFIKTWGSRTLETEFFRNLNFKCSYILKKLKF